MTTPASIRPDGAKGKILFATPHATDWCMVMYTRSMLTMKWPEGYGVTLADTMWGGMVVSSETFARMALDGGYTHLVMACNDAAWEPDALVRLMAHGKDVVSGWSAGRTHPFMVKAFVEIQRDKVLMRARPGVGKGLERVYSIAGELAVYDVDVFRRIKPPWFCGVDKLDGTPTTVDFAFGCKAYDAGVEIWVDWDVPITHRTDGLVTKGGVLQSL